MITEVKVAAIKPSDKPKPLRVLILEDRVLDAELMVRQLKSGGFDPIWRRVDNEQDYLSQLDNPPDVILADQHMPHFAAPDALRLLKQRGLDIPFIIVSGPIREEQAIARMKEGANDYLFKDRLTRLAPAVASALEEKQLRQQNAASQESIVQLAAIVESSDDSIVETTLDGVILSWNSAAERLYGYTAAEVKNRSISFIAPPERESEMVEIFDRIRRGEQVPHFETVRVRKDGTPIHISVTISPIKDAKGNIIGASAISHDIREQKQAQEVPAQANVAFTRGTRVREDLCIIAAAGLLVWGLSQYLDVFNISLEQILLENGWPMGELITAAVFVGFALAFFSLRRLTEARMEMAAHKKTEEALRTLHSQLEMRVQERTSGLARSNDSLKSEVAQRKLAEVSLETRNLELQTLQEIGFSILNSKDVNSALATILEKTLSITGLDVGGVRLFGPNGEVLYISFTGYQDAEAEKLLYQHAKGGEGHLRIIPQVIASRRTFVAGDIGKIDGLRSFKKDGVRSAVLVPICIDDKVLGVIQLGSRTFRSFEPEAIRFLEAIANQVGITVQKARLLEDTQKRLEHIRVLHEITLAITSTLDLKTILDVLLEKLDLIFRYPVVSTVRLFNKKTGMFELLSRRNMHFELSERDATRTLVGRGKAVLETRTAVIIRNLLTDPRTRDPDFYEKHSLISYLGVPLIAHDEALGVLGIYAKEERDFTNEEIAFLNTLASQASVAIRNSRLYEEIKETTSQLEATNQRLEKTVDELSGFYGALTPLAPAESLPHLMNAIIDRLMEVTGADATLIRVFDGPDALPIIGHRGFADEYLKRVDTAPGGGAVQWVATHGEPIIAPDIAKEPRLKGKVQLRLGLRSCALLPLKVGNHTRGVMHLASRELGYFDVAQKDHLTAIARHMGVVLENRELFDNLRHSSRKLEQANAALQESNRMLSVLHTVAAAASQSLELSQVLQAALGKITELFNLDAARIQIYDEATGELILKASKETDLKASPSGQSFKMGEGIVGMVAQNGKPLVFEDISNDPLYQQLSRSGVSKRHGRRFFAAFPIKGKLKHLGTLLCIGVIPRKLSTSETQLLEAVADQIAVAIENSELYESVERKVQELQQKTSELERASKVKDEFLSVMSHELRTPLNVIMGHAELLREQALGDINGEQLKSLQIICAESEELLKMINRILQATQFESQNVRSQSERIRPSELLDTLRSNYDIQLGKPLLLKWDYPADLPPVSTDGEKLRHVLQNLISNALKFTDRGFIAVSCRHLAQDMMLEFAVSDTGIGISEEYLPVIFNKFQQIDSSETRVYEGVGLGLYIVKKFTEMLGGTVGVTSTPGEGSTFTVRIPLNA